VGCDNFEQKEIYTHGDADDRRRLVFVDAQVNSSASVNGGEMGVGGWEAKKCGAHHVEEDVEGVVLGRIGREDEYERDRVDCPGLGHDRSFLCETEGPARAARRVLPHPETVGDQHYNNGSGTREMCSLSPKRERNERVQRPLTARVALKNDLVILSSLWTKMESAVVRLERP
jgi:hypothetical protein